MTNAESAYFFTQSELTWGNKLKSLVLQYKCGYLSLHLEVTVSHNPSDPKAGSDVVVAAPDWGWIPHPGFSCTCLCTCMTCMMLQCVVIPVLFTVTWWVCDRSVLSIDTRPVLWKVTPVAGVTLVSPPCAKHSWDTLMWYTHEHKETTACTWCHSFHSYAHKEHRSCDSKSEWSVLFGSILHLPAILLKFPLFLAWT